MEFETELKFLFFKVQGMVLARTQQRNSVSCVSLTSAGASSLLSMVSSQGSDSKLRALH